MWVKIQNCNDIFIERQGFPISSKCDSYWTQFSCVRKNQVIINWVLTRWPSFVRVFKLWEVVKVDRERERGVDTQLLLLLKTFHWSEYFEISEDQNNYLVLSHFITIALEAAHNAVLCNFGRVGGQNAQFIHSLFGGGARDAMFEKVLGWVMDTLFSEHMKLSLWAFTTEQENNAKIYCVRRNYHCWTQFGSPMARIANPHSLSIFWYSKASIETNCPVARKPINLVTIIILMITIIKIVMIVIINMIIILLTAHCCIWTGGRCNHCGSARPPRHSRPGSRGRRRIARPDHVDHGDDDDHDDDGRHGKFYTNGFSG